MFSRTDRGKYPIINSSSKYLFIPDLTNENTCPKTRTMYSPHLWNLMARSIGNGVRERERRFFEHHSSVIAGSLWLLSLRDLFTKGRRGAFTEGLGICWKMEQRRTSSERERRSQQPPPDSVLRPRLFVILPRWVYGRVRKALKVLNRRELKRG